MRYGTGNKGFGGSGMRIGPGRISPVIKYLIIGNLAIFILQNIFPQMTVTLGLWTKKFYSDFPNLLYQPLTYMFLHGSFGHIFFNMFALWMFGTEIELSFGPKRFLKLYLLAGLAGAFIPLIFQSGMDRWIVGASGAIYGVLGAYWVMFPNRTLYLYFVVPVKVKWAIPGFLIIGMLFGGANVSHLAHLGGAIFGVIYAKADWRFLSFGKKFKKMKQNRNEEKFEKNRTKAEDTMKRVDKILDKINEVGLDNISKEERKFLEEASKNLSDENIKEL